MLATERRKARHRVGDHGLSQQWASALVTWVLITEPPGGLPLGTEAYKEVRGLTFPGESPVCRVGDDHVGVELCVTLTH